MDLIIDLEYIGIFGSGTSAKIARVGIIGFKFGY